MTPKRDTTPRAVVVIGTGGTIAGRAADALDNIGYVAGQVDVADLLASSDVPPGVRLLFEQLAQVDSKDMTHSVWRDLAIRCAHWLAQPEIAGIVITHGTDTLEETAFFLQCVLSDDKPVVLTCAMRPASALAPDGPQNVRDAIVAAASAGARGVTVMCAGVLHAAQDVQKVHTYRLDAFTSGDSGAVGYVEEGHVRLVRNWPAPHVLSGDLAMKFVASDAGWPRVEIVTSHAGASGAVIDALLQPPQADGNGQELPSLRGVVIAATGNGTVHEAVEAAAVRAQSADIEVVRATRCAEGRILSKVSDVFRDAGGLTPVKARIALMLELALRET